MKTIYIYCLMTIAALSAATSCDKDDTPQSATGPIEARIMVCDGNGTRVGSDDTDNYIHQLRVYAFIGGEKVGYAEADNLSDRNYIPMTLSKIGSINFYVIANDKFGPNPKKQNEDGIWESPTKSGWESLSKKELESLKFDLTTGFNGWTPINGEFVSPMSNNPCDEFDHEFTGKNENNYTFAYTINPQDIPKSGSLVIPVTVQHVLGRLRLMLNKESDDVKITLTRAEVYHRPDAFRLYNSGTGEIAYDNNDNTLVEKLIDIDKDIDDEAVQLETRTDEQITQNTYTTVARTYLAPNLYGSSDPDTYTAQKTDNEGDGSDKAYRLELTVRFDYRNNRTETKNYTVYLPRVPRNTSIDVQGTFKGSTTINPAFNIMVNAWDEKNIDVPPFK